MREWGEGEKGEREGSKTFDRQRGEEGGRARVGGREGWRDG